MPSSTTSAARAIRSSRARRSCPRTTRHSCSPTRAWCQFKDVFVGKEHAAVHARDVEPEVHPHQRQAQRPRERRRHRPPPHVLRDARQLLLRRLLQGRGDRLRVGAADARSTACLKTGSSSRSSAARKECPPTTRPARSGARSRGFPDERILGIPGCRATTSGRWARRGRAGHAPRSTGSTATPPAASPYAAFGEEPTADGRRLDGDLEPRLHAVRPLDRSRPAEPSSPPCRSRASTRGWASSASRACCRG